MTRYAFLPALLLFAAPFIAAQGSREESREPFEIPPFQRIEFPQPALAGRDAQAIAIGNGRSAVGVYVFDPKGNCVAFDDEPNPALDDRVVVWTPTVTGLFGVQVRNLGFAVNTVETASK